VALIRPSAVLLIGSAGGASNAPASAITEISWKGLRCNLEVSGGTAGMAKAIDDGSAVEP
jgi:hypothetical protein